MNGSVDRAAPPEPAPLKPFRFPEHEELSLSNGIPLFFSRASRLPVVSFSVVLPAGAVREDPAHAGLATLTGSLLESGTDRLDALEIARRIEALGVRMHVGTSWEAASVEFTCLRERTGEAAHLAAHLITAASFPEAEVERIRHEQLAGIMQRRAEPRGLANEMANRYIFAPESPFARSVYGTAGTVSGLSRGDAAAFHAASFTPRESGIIIAGDLTAEEALRTAESAFGAWRGDAPPEARAVVRSRYDEARVVIVDRPGAVQSEIRVGHIGVARNVPDFFPLLVMNTILGGAFSSRLNLNLRERQGFTYGVSSAFVMRRKPGPFLVSTAVQTEVTGAAVREIVQELTRIREDRVTDDEMSDARNYVAGTFPLRLETTDGIASRLAELFIYDLPRSYLDEFADRVLAVSESEVLAAARSHLHPEKLLVLAVGDAETVRPQLEALSLGPVEIVPNHADH